MIAVAEALARIARATGPLGEELVAVSAAAGRTLARELVADGDYPPFDTTAMDGYAICAGGGPNPPGSSDSACRYRERPGVVGAGDDPGPGLAPGEAVRVMTGAPIPAGTTAIVPVEEATSETGTVLAGAPKPGAHIRRRGEVFRFGDALLPRGTRLSPEGLLLCATVGSASVPVWRLPRCGVAATGAELVAAADRPRGGQIRNGNGPALAGAFALRGIRAVEFPPLPDRRPELETFFSASISGLDLVVTTGGVSAGDFDETVKAAEAAGFEVLFHLVAIKPGKPIAFGQKGGTLWFGLPGNPVSAMTTFEVFVSAALDRIDGRPARKELRAELAGPVRHRPGREAYLDARIDFDGDRLRARPLRTRGSHDILCQSERNALLIVPAEGGDYGEGDVLSCLPLRDLPA
ncbi:MAG: molybdopterin molybdotransferase MoeA [Thermoanaerobaculia bacterium]